MLLRKWTLDDLDSLVKHANNKKIADNLTNMFPHPYTREGGENFIQYAQSHDPQQIFAIEIHGEACGGIGIHPQEDVFCRNAELGYWLSEVHWGSGYMTRCINEAVDYGFSTFAIDRIFARPFGSNLASQRILEKNGFELEARFSQVVFKNGRLEDLLVYGLRKP